MDNFDKSLSFSSDDADLRTPEGRERWIARLIKREGLSKSAAEKKLAAIIQARSKQPKPATKRARLA